MCYSHRIISLNPDQEHQFFGSYPTFEQAVKDIEHLNEQGHVYIYT